MKRPHRRLHNNLVFVLALTIGVMMGLRDNAYADALGLTQGDYVLYLDSLLDADTLPNYTGYISIGAGATGVTEFLLEIPPANWSYNISGLINDGVLLNSAAVFAIQDTQLPGATNSILAQLDWFNGWAYLNSSGLLDGGTWTAEAYSGPLGRVPEPSSLVLLLLGFLGYQLFRSTRLKDSSR